jgi:hypothetical protein
MTTDCTLDTSVVDWILEHPETQRVLESLGIDCSCAGKSLSYACDQQRLNRDSVLTHLHECIRRCRGSQGKRAGGQPE